MMIPVVLYFYWLVLEMLFGCMYLSYGFHACSRESVPCAFKQAGLVYGLFKGVCFLFLLLGKLVLSGPVLVKGLCPLFFVLLVSSSFLIYTILTFDQKKERALSLSILTMSGPGKFPRVESN